MSSLGPCEGQSAWFPNPLICWLGSSPCSYGPGLHKPLYGVASLFHDFTGIFQFLVVPETRGQKRWALVFPALLMLCCTLLVNAPESKAKIQKKETENTNWGVHRILLGWQPQIKDWASLSSRILGAHGPLVGSHHLVGLPRCGSEGGKKKREKERKMKDFPHSLWASGGPFSAGA